MSPTLTRMWLACAVLISLAAAINIADWIFHAYVVVFVLTGFDLLVLAVWVRLALRFRKELRL